MSSCQNTPFLPASTPRSADVVLYLDLDGVVHHEKVLWHPRKGIYMSPYEAAGHTVDFNEKSAVGEDVTDSGAMRNSRLMGTNTMRKEANEDVGHFITPKIAIDMQPMGQRIDSTHEPEHRQLHVARCNRAVLDTALKHFTQLQIELATP